MGCGSHLRNPSPLNRVHSLCLCTRVPCGPELCARLGRYPCGHRGAVAPGLAKVLPFDGTRAGKAAACPPSALLRDLSLRASACSCCVCLSKSLRCKRQLRSALESWGMEGDVSMSRAYDMVCLCTGIPSQGPFSPVSLPSTANLGAQVQSVTLAAATCS